MSSRSPERRLGDRHPREVFDEFATKAQTGSALDSMTRPLALLLDSGIWTSLQTGVRQPVMRNLLGTAMRQAGVVLQESRPRELPPVQEYVHYLDASFSLRLHMTDSPDPLTIEHLTSEEAKDLRDDPEKIGELIERLSPFIFVVTGVGIVYWDGHYGRLDHTVARTAVLTPIRQVSEWARKDRGCLIPLDTVSPAKSRRKQNESGALLAAFAAAHAACGDPASLRSAPTGRP